MSLSEETGRYRLGRAKKRMFGKQIAKWPQLEDWVESKKILAIEKAYAEMWTTDEQEALDLAQQLASMRDGYLTNLPKHQWLIETIVKEITRLNGEMQTAPIEIDQTLNSEQKKALSTAFSYRLSIITGGPGTGKTFTASAIIRAFKGSTVITAPTGKAAAYLFEKAKKGSGGTLHAVLRVKTPLDLYKTPQKLDKQLVIVDECSMIDPALFAHLLSAIPDTAHLVLMGDPNQLPPVEGGSVFADLIASKAIPKTQLKTCMRSDRKEILDLASDVLKGFCENIRTVDLGFSSGSIKTIYERIVQYAAKEDFSSFRILSTLRRGPLGVNALNQFLFEELKSKRVPILVTRNDSQKGFSNGDTAMVENGVAHFADGRKVLRDQLPPHEIAYCLSVHKAQGSEYDHVLFLIPEGSESFGREILYTAITRARRCIAIDGDPEQIAKALNHSALKPSTIRQRVTTLQAAIETI